MAISTGMSTESPLAITTPRHAPSDEDGLSLYSANDLALCSSEEARNLVPYESALRLGVLPLSLVGVGQRAKLHCAVHDDSDEVRRALFFVSGKDVVVSVAPKATLDDAIVRAYLGSDRRIRSQLERLSDNLVDRGKPAGSEIPRANGDAAQFLQTLIEFSVARGASDLHLCPTPEGAVIRLRIDGELLAQDDQPYPQPLHEQVVGRLKVLSGLDIACKRFPQDGAFSMRVGSGARSIRLSTLPAVNGESVVLRFLYARKLPQLSMLGIEPMTMGCIRHAIAKTHGVVLLTGPTGSGKTTTMYSLALELQNRGRNVVSVEDPVEIPIPGMVQVQVREQQGLEYPKAIRSVLRHDPDIILIGEIRDPASAQIAMSVGSTGHLTISSVHVGSALQVLERFRSFDIAPRDAAHAISLVLNQRLLPKLCDACKIIDETAQGRFSSVVYRETGCDVCQGSGFSGRVLLTEALDLQSYRVKEIFSRTVSINEALSELPSSAVIPWYRSLEHHLLKGHISPRQLDLFVDSEMAAD